MTFAVAGGAGGRPEYGGGAGDSISAGIGVKPGQIITLFAGGAGGVEVAGISNLASGGVAYNGGGGGGGASFVYLQGSMLAWAGGGGGGSVPGGSAVPPLGKATGVEGTVHGNANTQGKTAVIYTVGSPPGQFDSRAGGGLPGVFPGLPPTGAGAGGNTTGASTSVAAGNPGSGFSGGDGVRNPQPGTNSTYPYGGSGAGGGGIFGGGSGASLYWADGSGSFYTIAGGGGGGASYVSPSLGGVSRAADNYAPGRVIIRFS